VTSPKSQDRANLPPSAAALSHAEATNAEPALLLDLSGNKEAASRWAARQLPGAPIRLLSKADLKWGSKLEALRRVRALSPHTLALFTSDIDTQSQRGILMVFAVLAGARRVLLGDQADRTVFRSSLGVLVREAPKLVLETLFGYGIVVPVSWLMTVILGTSLRFRRIISASAVSRRIDPNRTASRTVLYLRATLSAAAEGGLSTHVAGFRSGATALGHRLRFIESGTRSATMHEQSTDSDVSGIVSPIPPSARVGASKALFELWNNLIFTRKSLELVGDAAEIDFIYQRYSRFNFTGVALSVVTGLPLLLEFNGSEVWVSKHWDPVGQTSLLKRFERLNLRAADIIFVVSEVAKRQLIRDADIDPESVVVNPNGVDTEVFRPNCGGDELRRELGCENKTVVGFVGTFGPWHGAPVLAEAASVVSEAAGCHFLFVGDGDERSVAEGIVEKSRRSSSAVFTGRIPHNRIPAYLDACDILVSPHVPPTDGGEFFGSPTKLFEYLAMARPVVASRIGQIADVIIDQENGLLVEPGDAKELARAIELLAADKALCARLGAAARKTVLERYTWKHNAARVFETHRSR
jgi:glycosyltransferase involved in cell wall biosynthesis